MEIYSANGANELSSKLSNLDNHLVILYFYIDDSAECNQMSEIINELSKNEENKNAAFIKVNASKDEEIGKKYNVTSVPAFIFLRNGDVVDSLVGANVPALSKKIEENMKDPIEDRLKKLVNKAPVMLFMKGSPSIPRCGFSKQVIELLNSHNAKYETFDILEDFEVREALKIFSNWPTYPQLYVKEAHIKIMFIEALGMPNIFQF
ncbi:glutaredoxin 3 [Trichonephila clavata]|uniref:Glutaredoxin 3 n=1 Tax=Trichonephila clavata TaxID=2740835 RepID=A0A8X6IT26_TRICU|nr:glutaredoxin 3 [Trichonephila clavata]